MKQLPNPIHVGRSAILVAILPAFVFLSFNLSSGLSDYFGTRPPATPEIEAIAPEGDIVWELGDPLDFLWTSLDGYAGTYKLKVLQLQPNDPIPAELPDMGLFFSLDSIADTSYQYPATAPPFQYGLRYAWQVETTALVNGFKKKSPVIIYYPIASCSMTISGAPVAQLCPGDCFVLAGTLTANSLLSPGKKIAVFTDHPNPASVTVNGAPANAMSLYSTPTSVPFVLIGSGNSYAINVCVNEGAASPFTIKVFFYKMGPPCMSDPFGATCCHDEENITVEVSDLDNYDLDFSIQDPFTGLPEQAICSGESVKFVLDNLPSPATGNIVWQFSENGGPFTDINDPVFNDNFTFVVPGGIITADCDNNPDGYLERYYRAHITSTNGTDVCEYFTEPYALQICCPITNASLSVTPNATLCEGGSANVTVTLSSTAPFVVPPGTFVDIVWCLPDGSIGFADQTSFITNVTAGVEDLCFKAKITNCAGKELTVEQCIPVELMPKCGTIAGTSATLAPIACDPLLPTGTLCYEICDGNDATLEATGFMNCGSKRWQFTDDPTDPLSWQDLGSSNDVQNTNTLLPSGWDCIYFQVKCEPISDPSPCVPCFSNLIKIKKKTALAVPLITGPTTVCLDDLFALEVDNVEAGVDYTWYCNGLESGTGTGLILLAKKDACYWVEASNDCETVESDKHCVRVCEVEALISCPLVPNECACLGEPIQLTAAYSFSTCIPFDLVYEWHWVDEFGIPQTSTSDSITDTPPAGGTLYSLTVTDLETGCTDEAELFIKPCDKN